MRSVPLRIASFAVLSLAALASSPALAQLGRPVEADEAYSRAEALYQEGMAIVDEGDEDDEAKKDEAKAKFEQAVQELSKAVELDELFVEAHILQGDTLKELGDYGAAIKSYSTAIDLKPEPKSKLAHALNGRGECYKDSETPFIELAMNDFDSAYELDRRSAEIAANYGDMLINVLRDARRAIRVLDKAIELDPENAEAWADRGWARAQLREFDEAIEDLKKAIELDPEEFKNYATLANIYVYQEDYAPAVDALTEAIAHYKPEESTDPDIYANGYLQLADARQKLAKELDDPEKAREQYEQILKDSDAVLAEYPDQYPEAGYALFRRGVALRMLERYSEAIKTLNDAIQLVPAGEEAPYLAEAYLKRGICWHYQGQDALARGDFEQSASINYEDPLAQLWIGYTYAQEGEYRQAIDAYGEAISLNPKFSLAYVNRALAYVQVGSYKKAIDNFNHAIRHEPSEASHYYLRGLTHNLMKDYQKALDSFQLAILNDPQMKKAYVAAAEALRKLDRPELAAEYDAQAAAIPDTEE